MPNRSSIVTVSPRRAPPILVCKKCLKRADDGREFKRALKSEVKRESASRAIKRPKVVMTECFGLCPKHAVVVASGATLRNGEYLLVADKHAVADATAVLMGRGDT